MIMLTEQEWRAVDTACFQRLRAIRQLARTDLVYPGATHNRFEHSIGVCHVARRIAEAPNVALEPDKARVVRLAALLHDLGHGPFSHVSEQVLDERGGRVGTHEEISAALMRTEPSLRAAIGGDDADEAARIVAKEGTRSVLQDIVTGPTDADKLDYLLRDSRYAGVTYGQYDLGRILDTITIINPGKLDEQLGFEADGVEAVELLLLARHHMHRQVYGHKTRIASDLMVTRALRAGIDDGVLPVGAYTPPAEISEEFLREFLTQTDASVMVALLGQEQITISKQLALCLNERCLLRRAASIDLLAERPKLGGRLFADVTDGRFDLGAAEQQIADALGIDRRWVGIYVDSRKNPIYRRTASAIDDRNAIMLRHPDREPDTFEQTSEIFSGGDVPAKFHLRLYVPRIDGTHPFVAQNSANDNDLLELLWETLKA
jgi:HD superfamily phosphohydrolase